MPLCVGYDLRSDWPCNRLSIGRYVLGCVHEHVAARELCRWHLDDVIAGNHRCGNCAEAGCGCTLVLLEQEA